MTHHDNPYIVITGAAGFIGSCLVRFLNDHHIHNLVLFDHLGDDGRWKNLLGKSFLEIHPHHQLLTWLKGKSSEIKAIIHLGACSDTGCRDMEFLLQNNTRYSIQLAEYALEHHIRFIYASSAATYGANTSFLDEEKALDSLRPLNPYGFSKHLFDLWLSRHHLLSQVTGLKYFNVYGPNEYHKENMSSAILKMVWTATTQKSIFLFCSQHPDYSDGEQKRDFIYVKDAVAMTAYCIDHDLFGIYNIGTGSAHSWNELAHQVIAALNRPISIEYIPLPSALAQQYQYYTQASMEKWKNHHGIMPAYSFKDSILEYVDYIVREAYW